MDLKKIQHPWRFFWRGIFLPFLGWIFIIPVSFLFPKKNNLVLFIGRDIGEFVDNVKYLFLYVYKLKRNNIKFFFLTGSRTIINELEEQGFPVIYYPRFKTIFYLMRASTIIVDNLGWIGGFKYHFLIRAKKIQLWHGAPLKKIGLDNKWLSNSIKSYKIKLYYFLKGRFPVYDLLLSPSITFTEKSFSTAIKSKQIIESGYPRNASMILKPDPLFLVGTDLDSINKVSHLKSQGYKIILYLPTFRDGGRNALTEKNMSIEMLDDFALKEKLVFIFKFHMWELGVNSPIKKKLEQVKNIILYDNNKDIYPLLGMSELLITDYSSIYLDYLILDKPIIFYSYDLDKYMSKDRELYFDYEYLTPGPKCFTQEELHREILNCINSGGEAYKEKRERIKKLTFKYYDGRSSERIWKIIEEKFIK